MSYHEQIIADYKKAFEAANLKPLPGSLTYENGWFIFREERYLPVRYGRDQILQMTANLKARVAKETSDENA